MHMREIGLRPAGDHPDPAHWERIRAAALARDGTCRLCRDARQLECHHNTYDRWGREELDDVIIVCRGCHDAVTGAQMRLRDERRQMPAPRLVTTIERLASTPSDHMPGLTRVPMTIEHSSLPGQEPPPPPTREPAAIERLAWLVAADLPPPARHRTNKDEGRPWTTSGTST
jgi:hypothetical protein